jgi:hypothetical protein
VPAADLPSDHLAESILPLIRGIATAAKMLTMSTTTINSTNVKPFLFFILFSPKKKI